MTSKSSQRSRSDSIPHSEKDLSRSRSPANRRSYTRSRSRSYSHHTARSTYSSRSKSGSKYSRSISSDRRNSRSWSRSRSHSRRRSIYSSRSCSRSRSGYRSGSRRYRSRSRSRNHSYDSRNRSRSRSHSSNKSSSQFSHSKRYSKDKSMRVKWTNNVWIVGERAKDTVFHFCDLCDLPIVIYGRLLPCKHVLCYNCALTRANKCHRCQKAVQSMERCLVGGIFMCFQSDNCRRTYLSQRDLQAHIDHRHKSTAPKSSCPTTTTLTSENPPDTADSTKLVNLIFADSNQNRYESTNNITLSNPAIMSVPKNNNSNNISNNNNNNNNNNNSSNNNLSLLSPQIRMPNTIPMTSSYAGSVSDRILPLTQTNTSNLLMNNQLPMGIVNRPLCPPVSAMSNSGVTPFPTLPQLCNLPPHALAGGGHPAQFLSASSIQAPATIGLGQAPQQHPDTALAGSNVVAALAAAVSAISSQCKTHLNSFPPSIGPGNPSLQNNALASSMLTNAMRSSNLNWVTMNNTGSNNSMSMNPNSINNPNIINNNNINNNTNIRTTNSENIAANIINSLRQTMKR